MQSPYPAADPHLPLRELFPGVWLAASQITMPVPLGMKIKFSRNMVGLLQSDGWVLVNPVRLSEAGETELLAKGPIRHAIRLGTFHGRDDAYYVERFGATFWAAHGKQDYDHPPIARNITDGGELPIPSARAIVFKGGLQAESAILLPQHKLLITCDSVQHYEKDPLVSPLGKVLMRMIGFFTPCVIGPFWLKAVTPPGGSMRPDFERILALDWDNLIAGHGTLKHGGARQALARNVEKLP